MIESFQNSIVVFNKFDKMFTKRIFEEKTKLFWHALQSSGRDFWGQKMLISLTKINRIVNNKFLQKFISSKFR